MFTELNISPVKRACIDRSMANFRVVGKPEAIQKRGCEKFGRTAFHLDDKRIIKGRPFGVGFDRSHLNLQQGAPS
jgi:hypothetical protein